ncbi:5-formyltetrahydrofolate cyclo-ligase [Allopontixanthobacter sp.]|uniref:5-formyltetrahydrofolate cyclo-ligase n=1 Tax=Allopontixanthobacter sp. TaxID=2906452 RepID=UPI002ABD0520|nr:5-formyltetrahydrofolate cyclo-ligase [Allopontixanthobacter sp.]MDZ4307943.1 5-formyltetrahydrofolate cyclo-ligase [Allopontixanthobacter sp.]
MTSKAALRTALRKARRDHVASLPGSIQALLFKRPPEPLMALIPDGAVIGLYHAAAAEAPAGGYAKFFLEAGHPIALPRLRGEPGAMDFRAHTDPFEESDLEPGPHNLMQPRADAPVVTPEVVFVPLLGFTSVGHRLGQGGGYYDRWLAANPDVTAIGMGWDMQLLDEIPCEAHDLQLNAVVTPTRIYGPFNA